MTVPGDWTDNVPKRLLQKDFKQCAVPQKSYFSAHSLLGSYERRGYNGSWSSAVLPGLILY